jgi:hypothetical protein
MLLLVQLLHRQPAVLLLLVLLMDLLQQMHALLHKQEPLPLPMVVAAVLLLLQP